MLNSSLPILHLMKQQICSLDSLKILGTIDGVNLSFMLVENVDSQGKVRILLEKGWNVPHVHHWIVVHPLDFFVNVFPQVSLVFLLRHHVSYCKVETVLSLSLHLFNVLGGPYHGKPRSSIQRPGLSNLDVGPQQLMENPAAPILLEVLNSSLDLLEGILKSIIKVFVLTDFEVC